MKTIIEIQMEGNSMQVNFDPTLDNRKAIAIMTWAIEELKRKDE